MRKYLKYLALGFLALTVSGCGLQQIPIARNDAEAKLAEVFNQYKRRADLIPSLVEVVKGYATHERGTFTDVAAARARATSMTIDPSHSTPQQLAGYAQAQGQLSQALGKLMMITENYPELKANEQFKDLQAQLEGTENRITISRNNYIATVQAFNNLVTVFPTSLTASLILHETKMAQWDLDADEKVAVEKAPVVKF